jgi:hypothetical protein
MQLTGCFFLLPAAVISKTSEFNPHADLLQHCSDLPTQHQTISLSRF